MKKILLLIVSLFMFFSLYGCKRVNLDNIDKLNFEENVKGESLFNELMTNLTALGKDIYEGYKYREEIKDLSNNIISLTLVTYLDDEDGKEFQIYNKNGENYGMNTLLNGRDYQLLYKSGTVTKYYTEVQDLSVVESKYLNNIASFFSFIGLLEELTNSSNIKKIEYIKSNDLDCFKLLYVDTSMGTNGHIYFAFEDNKLQYLKANLESLQGKTYISLQTNDDHVKIEDINSYEKKVN